MNIEYMKITVSSRARSKTKMRMHMPRTYAAQEPQRNDMIYLYVLT